jgi:putative membrane protein
MYIDYTPLMLVNLVAGLVLLAAWVFLDLDTERERRWVPAMATAGVVGLAAGLHMIFTWPLPGALNTVYGPLSVFYGILLLGLAFVLSFRLDVLPVAIYAAFAGLATLLLGIQVFQQGLTPYPQLTGAALAWMGVVGLDAVPMLRIRAVPAFRVLAAIGLLVAAVLWGVVAYLSAWQHVAPATQWKPATLQYQLEMNKARQ